MSKNTTCSAGNGMKPQRVVLEALEGYSIIIQEVYTEAEKGEHWAGVPEWPEYLDSYVRADTENRTQNKHAELPDIPER